MIVTNNNFQTPHHRLLLIHTECTELRGGEKFIYELAKRISKHRPVILFVEKISTYWKKHYAEQGIHIHLLWKPKHLYWGLLPLTLVINTVRLKKFVAPDDTLFATNFPLSFLATLLSKKTIIFTFEPLSIFYDRFRYSTISLKDRIILTCARWCYEPIDHIAIKNARILATLNTDVAKEITNRYHRTPDVLIPNGVDRTFFSPTSPPLYTSKNKNLRIFGHSTDYTPLKGTELLLSAIPYIVKKNPSFLLLISDSVPNNIMRKRYVSLIKSLGIQQYVRFIGSISKEKVPGFYTSCSSFFYCGSTRCVGGCSASLSVIEAASCGLPVLRTKGNTNEIIDGKTGFYFPSETPQHIADTTLMFMSLPKTDVKRMKIQARKHVSNTFSWDVSAKILKEAIY